MARITPEHMISLHVHRMMEEDDSLHGKKELVRENHHRHGNHHHHENHHHHGNHRQNHRQLLKEKKNVKNSHTVLQ